MSALKTMIGDIKEAHRVIRSPLSVPTDQHVMDSAIDRILDTTSSLLCGEQVAPVASTADLPCELSSILYWRLMTGVEHASVPVNLLNSIPLSWLLSTTIDSLASLQPHLSTPTIDLITSASKSINGTHQSILRALIETLQRAQSSRPETLILPITTSIGSPKGLSPGPDTRCLPNAAEPFCDNIDIDTSPSYPDEIVAEQEGGPRLPTADPNVVVPEDGQWETSVEDGDIGLLPGRRYMYESTVELGGRRAIQRLGKVTDPSKLSGLDALPKLFACASGPIIMRHPSGAGISHIMDHLGGHLTDDALAALLDFDTWAGEETVTVGDSKDESGCPMKGSAAYALFSETVCKTAPPPRPRTILSAEFSHLPIARVYEPPNFVQHYSWQRFGSPPGKTTASRQRYFGLCDAGSVTGFHADYSGSTVLVQVLQGTKIFYFAEPTNDNLAMTMAAANSDPQQPAVFEDRELTRVKLKAGDAAFIPAGWIHAVATITPAVMISCNFLHDYAIALQIRMWELEQQYLDVHTEQYFLWLTWCALQDLFKRLKKPVKDRPLPPMSDLLLLCEFSHRYALPIAVQSDVGVEQVLDTTEQFKKAVERKIAHRGEM